MRVHRPDNRQRLGHRLALRRAQPVPAPALVTLGLRDPVAERLGGGFEPSTFGRQQHRYS